MEFIIVIGWIEGGYCLVGYLECDKNINNEAKRIEKCVDD